jgi:putative ABC transport system permease protein
MLISYQILFNDVSELLPQYATLKAIGYESVYLIRVILEQAIFYAVAGFLPAWLVCAVLFKILGEYHPAAAQNVNQPYSERRNPFAMCIVSGLLAVRRILAADPAEVFLYASRVSSRGRLCWRRATATTKLHPR